MAEYVRGDRVGARNRLSVRYRLRGSTSVTSIGALLETLAEPGFTAEEWRSASEAAAAHAYNDVVPFREAPMQLLDQLWRGVEGEATEAAWASLPTEDAFREFTEVEGARPVRVGICTKAPVAPLIEMLEAIAPVRVVDASELLRRPL